MVTDKSTVTGQIKDKPVKARRSSRPALEKSAEAVPYKAWDLKIDLLIHGGLQSQLEGDLARAQELFENALGSAEQYGPQDETVKLLNQLGFVLHKQGFLARSRSAYERALAMLKQLRGPGGFGALIIARNFAHLLEDQGDHEGARLLLERVAAADEFHSRPRNIFEVEFYGSSLILDAPDARDLHRGLLQFRQQNDRTLKDDISDDQLLIALKNRGISPDLVKQVAAELVRPVDDQIPEMTERDLQQLAKQTKTNAWSSDLGKLPSEFISLIYKKWLGKKRLMREHISSSGGEKLIAAYATEIHDHPERLINDLGQRPHTRHGALPDHLPKAPSNRWIPTAELSDEERTNRRLSEAKRKREQRARNKPSRRKITSGRKSPLPS